MSGQGKKATRWKRNRKLGDLYGGRARVKLSDNIFSRCHSIERPSQYDSIPILIQDNPSRQYFFPISVDECWQAIRSLPSEDTDGLTHIWCRRPSGKHVNSVDHPFAEFICGSGVRVVVMYPWPRSMRMTHGSKKPTNQFRNEIERYDAKIEFSREQWISSWSLAGLRQFYVEVLLLHEIGHHVDWYSRHWSKSNKRNRESFANEYAMRRTALGVKVLDYCKEKLK